MSLTDRIIVYIVLATPSKTRTTFRPAFHPTQRKQRNALAYFLTQLTQAMHEKYASRYATNAINAADASDATAKDARIEAVSIVALRALHWMETRL